MHVPQDLKTCWISVGTKDALPFSSVPVRRRFERFGCFGRMVAAGAAAAGIRTASVPSAKCAAS
jgi:hypothetical protein